MNFVDSLKLVELLRVLAELKISVVVIDFHGLKRIIWNQVRSTKEACGEGNGLVGKSKTGNGCDS